MTRTVPQSPPRSPEIISYTGNLRPQSNNDRTPVPERLMDDPTLEKKIEETIESL